MTTRRRTLQLGTALAAAAAVGATWYSRSSRETASTLTDVLVPGDLVFRAGASAESWAVRGADAGALWSHVGVAVRDDHRVRVVHAAPAEHGRPAGVLALTWEDYALTNDVIGVSIYRVGGLAANDRDRMAAIARSFVGRPFNSAFLLDTASGLYCTQVALASCAAVDPSVLELVRPTPVTLLADPVFLPTSMLTWPRLHEVARA